MVEADVVAYLAAQGSLGLTAGTNLFEGPLPEQTAAEAFIVGVAHYASQRSDQYVMGASLTAPGFEVVRFQVMVRGPVKATVSAKAAAIHALLDNLGTTPNFGGSGRTYFSVHADGEPFGLGQDKSPGALWRYVANYEARKHRG